MKKKRTCPILLSMLLAVPLLAQAQDEAAETRPAGPELTPVGAIQAGNEDGSIPPWEGGITKPPANYVPGKFHPDPYPEDKPLFTITRDNYAEYTGKLTTGHLAMFQRYPNWKMQVYPTRRSAALPPAIYENCKQNTTHATITNQGNGIARVKPGVAFPVPESGVEAIWNHLFRYRADSMRRIIGQAAPDAKGRYAMVEIDERALWLYNHDQDNMLARYLQIVRKPARLSGEILLVYESLDQVAQPRRAWKYNKGLRKTIAAPNVAHQHPGTAADGQRTSDNLDMFNGSPERYNWNLVSRQEKFVPYNSYRLHSPKLDYDDILQAGHINPDHARYELHRVWEVDASLKDGQSHIYKRRIFYLDEDSWQILAVDHFDKAGKLWRVGEAHTINYYEVPFIWDTLQCFYDLKNGRYLVYGLNNQGQADEFNLDLRESDFKPNSLRRLGR